MKLEALSEAEQRCEDVRVLHSIDSNSVKTQTTIMLADNSAGLVRCWVSLEHLDGTDQQP